MSTEDIAMRNLSWGLAPKQTEKNVGCRRALMRQSERSQPTATILSGSQPRLG